MLDLEIISLNTRGLSDYTKRCKVFSYFRGRPLLMELFLHKKHTVPQSVKFLGCTSGAERTQSDFHMELPLVETFLLPSVKSWTM